MQTLLGGAKLDPIPAGILLLAHPGALYTSQECQMQISAALLLFLQTYAPGKNFYKLKYNLYESYIFNTNFLLFHLFE